MSAPAGPPRPVAGLLTHPLLRLFAIFLVLPFVVVRLGTTYSIATEILIFSLLAMAFNILLGYGGLLSFGHGAFFGIGAYGAALTYTHLTKGMLVPMLVGILASMVMGAAIGFLLMRKRGVYFSLLTLAFTQMFFYIVYRATALTGGENGIGGLERSAVAGLDFTHQLIYYYLVAAVVSLAIVLIWRLVHSPFGRVLLATRENERRANCVGYDPKRYKLIAFTISCGLAGLAGTLHAFLLNFVYPETLHVSFSGEIVAMTLVGGMRNFFGPVVGAMFFVFARDTLSSYTENWMVFFGVVFMAFILFSPNGITGAAQSLWDRLRSRGRPLGAAAAPVMAAAGSGASDGEAVGPAGLRAIGEPILTTHGLVKRFGALAAVDGVDLTVRKGELHSIIGPNGAGKTTFFNALFGILESDGGEVRFKGEPISGLRPDQIVARGISRSFQIISVFQELPVLENVRIAVQARSPHRFDLLSRAEKLADLVEEARGIVGLVGLAGKEAMTASSLSHGDQRLLEIGIALATAPEVLLLDEPLAGLSPRERVRVGDLIRRLAERVTIVLIEHDIDQVLALSDRITVLHQGKVIAEGTPAEIQQDRQVQEAYLGGLKVSEVEHRTAPSTASLLSLERINTFYGKSHILHDVSLEVREGEVVCLLGRNGAGKTTTLSSIMGTASTRTGAIQFRGQSIAGAPPEEIGRLGIGLVPQGRRIFPNLTVMENLLIARRNGKGRWDAGSVFRLFPKLEQLKSRRGEHLSGGELQMLAIARALMGNPQLLLLDEPFEGLAPAIVEGVWRALAEIRGTMTLLLVEQNADLALALGDRAYVINNGQIEHSGGSHTLMHDHDLRKKL
ncbi:MAG TPA: branched-chain amino acid ABC transporter ATP-binding protein/permease, partial [Candidatus Acidoferrum sp.]|nr:branched-chain amino acid ABC transporter ATP-binding protein/permease [Candidatus Acidoferrum sp.]